jgi:hypothetical protein
MTDPAEIARVEVAAKAMANAVIRDDEGEFPRLFDLLDFGGENKAWTVTRGLARAALTVADPRLATLEAENARLRAALAPFANKRLHSDTAAKCDEVREPFYFSLGDLRRARAALTDAGGAK